MQSIKEHYIIPRLARQFILAHRSLSEGGKEHSC
jgi:hypothetical protein